jgi:hypothetical protein
MESWAVEEAKSAAGKEGANGGLRKPRMCETLSAQLRTPTVLLHQVLS